MRTIHRSLTILVLLLSASTTLDAQNIARSYKNGLKALYEEDFETARNHFSTAFEIDDAYEDVAFRLELTEHMTSTSADREMNTFLAFSSTSDHFFYYWLGRIYYQRGEPEKAMEAYEQFLSTDGYKSPQILAETEFLFKQNEEIVEYYANEPSISIVGRVRTESGQALLKGEVIYRPENNINQSYSAEIKEEGAYSLLVVPEALYIISIKNGEEVLGTDRLQVNKQDLEKNLTISIPEAQQTAAGLVAEKEVKNETIEQPKKEEVAANVQSTKSGVGETYPTAPLKESVQEKSDSADDDEISMLANKYRTRNKVIANNIYFDPGTSQLKPSSSEVIERIYTLLKNNPRIKIEIAGHTDGVGSEDVNAWLSQRRAEAVMNQLIKLGIPKAQMVAKGYGEAFPLATNDDEENGRELNRRIEILLIE